MNAVIGWVRFTCAHCRKTIYVTDRPHDLWNGEYVCEDCSVFYRKCPDCEALMSRARRGLCPACEQGG
jgi:hypothetical protein